MKKVSAVLAMCFWLGSGCQNNPVVPEATQIVLQAYLYDGEPVTGITVLQSRTVSSTDTVNTAVPNANVFLVKNGTRYHLVPSTQTAGEYYYPGNDLQVQSGNQFAVEVTSNGTTATAETVVPGKPLGLSENLPLITFSVDSVVTRSGSIRRLLTSLDSVIISWNNPSQLAHYVVLESDDSARVPMRLDSLGNVSTRRRFVTEPTTNNFYHVPLSSFEFTGKYKITLFRVNKEYVDLYASRQQDSRSLKEPMTNVKNGLGVFTAFASDSTFLAVQLK